MKPGGEAPLIDLGLGRDVPGRGEGRRDWSRYWSPAARQRLALAGCLALVLLAMAGAAPPPRPSLFLVDHQPSADATGYALVDDQLFVMTGGEGSALSAYRVHDARLLWSVPATGVWLGAFRASARSLLVVTQPVQGGCCLVTAYDRANGRVRWSRQGDPTDVDFGGDLLAMAVGASKQVIDVWSGLVRWQGDASAVVRVCGPHRILLAYPDGTVERRDLSTGEIQARGRIHPPDEQLSTATIVDSELIVGSGDGSESATVAAYDVDSLRLVWRRAARLVDGASRCGSVLCLRAGYGLEAVDPRTGSVRWRQAEWYGLEQGGRVLAFTAALGRMPAVGVVDPLTGRVLLDLGVWDLHAGAGRDRELVLTRASTGGTTVAVADLTGLTIQVVGVIPDLVAGCQVGERRLACRNAGGRLQLWAYRR